jgi:DHA2 family multidrug resistance protein
LKDWFGSTEICIEATVAAVAFYLFIVHMLTTTRQRFVSPALFKDRNFITGNIFIFVFGVGMFATLALLPPMLQDLLNYPVVTTGFVTAPRGIGTLIGMFVAPRVLSKIDGRAIIAGGFALNAFSAWQMTHFDLQMDAATVVWSGLAQGLGVGFIYVPVTAATFATLTPALRNEGTAFYSLMRNLGSSIGISVVVTLLTRNTQILHASLAEHVSPYSPLLREWLRTGGPHAPHALVELNTMVTQQAAMVAYDDDFKLLLLLSLATIPLVFFLRSGTSKSVDPVDID